MFREHTFDTGDVSINYAEGLPSGPPLVLIHGISNRWQVFLPIIPALSMRWHVYALDTRGHGKSGRVRGRYRPEHYFGDTTAFLEHVIAEPVILYGHSAGGVDALYQAARLPEKVRAVIVGDSPLDMERHVDLMNREGSINLWANRRDLAGRPMEELVSLLSDGTDAAGLLYRAKTLSQIDPDVFEFHAEGRAREFFENLDVEWVLRNASCPVLLLQGDPSRGGYLIDSEVEHALSLLPEATHVRIENVDHMLGLTAWEVAPFLRAVTGFLESL